MSFYFQVPPLTVIFSSEKSTGKDVFLYNFMFLKKTYSELAKLILVSLVLVASICLSSCSIFGSDEFSNDNNTSDSYNSDNLTTRTRKPKRSFTRNTNNIRLVWSIPPEPVDGFILNVSYNGSLSDTEIKIPVEELEKFDHPKYGFVFGYTLNGVFSDSGLKVTARSYLGDEVSPPGLVYAVGE